MLVEEGDLVVVDVDLEGRRRQWSVHGSPSLPARMLAGLEIDFKRPMAPDRRVDRRATGSRRATPAPPPGACGRQSEQNAAMERTTLGRTGIQVSRHCLGAMMFGAWGNRDHDDCRPHHPRRSRRRHQLHRHRRRVLGGGVRGDRRQGDQGPARRRRAGDEVRGADGRGHEPAWRVPAVDHPRGREQPAPARHRLHRPLPGPPARPDAPTSTRRSARSPTSSTRARSGSSASSTYPAELIVEAQWVAERRGRERFQCEQPPYSIFARGIETAVLPTCQRYGMGVIPWSPLAGGWLTGKYRKGDPTPTTGRASRIPDRFDFDKPENQRKLDLVEELLKLASDAGMSLTHLAHGVRAGAPGGDLGDHRTAARWSSSPTCVAAADAAPHRRRARQDRRARPAGDQRQRRRRRVAVASAVAACPPRWPAPTPLTSRTPDGVTIAMTPDGHHLRGGVSGGASWPGGSASAGAPRGGPRTRSVAVASRRAASRPIS